MAATSQTPTELTPAQALVDEVAQSDRGDALRRRLQHKYEVSPDDVLDAYWAAYVSVRHAKSLRGTTEAEVASYLARAVENRLIDELRRRKHERPASDELIAAAAPPTNDPIDADLIEQDNPVELEPVVAAIADGLSERQRTVLSLFCSDTPRREIAQRLNISDRRAKKDIEAILKKSRRTLLRLAGGGCADGEAPTTKLAFGLLTDAAAVTAAQHHLASCAMCSALYERLDLFRDKAAALLPVPAVEHMEPGFVARAAGRASEVATSVREHAVDGRRQMLEHTQQLKAHATGKLIDPTPLSGVRPGSALAVAGSCIAVGSGAGACLKGDVNPVSTIANAVAADERPQRPEADRSSAPPEQPSPGPVPPVLPQTPAAQDQPAAAPAPTVPVTPQPTPEPPPPSSESQFDPGAGATASTDQAAQPPPPPAAPKPAPSTGSKEFQGP